MNMIARNIKGALAGKTIRSAYCKVVISEEIESAYEIIIDTDLEIFSISCSADGFLKINIHKNSDNYLNITPKLRTDIKKCHVSGQNILEIELMKVGQEYVGVRCHLRELKFSVYNGGDELRVSSESLTFIGEEAVEYVSIA